MSTSLSKPVDNLSEIYHKECKGCKERKKDKSACDLIGLKIKLCYKCKECKKVQLQPINGLIKNFSNTYEFSNRDINEFVLLLRKGVYPYEYIGSWEKFGKTLPDKKAFYSEFNLEDITDEDCTHAQKVFEKFKLKNLGDYHNLYVQNDTLLLADVFENFRNKCIEIYELDPAHFLSASRLLDWQACLKKTGIELELLTDIIMLLMTEKGIQGRICHAIHRYTKVNNKYMENYDINISSYLKCLNANNLYG